MQWETEHLVFIFNLNVHVSANFFCLQQKCAHYPCHCPPIFLLFHQGFLLTQTHADKSTLFLLQKCILIPLVVAFRLSFLLHSRHTPQVPNFVGQKVCARVCTSSGRIFKVCFLRDFLPINTRTNFHMQFHTRRAPPLLEFFLTGSKTYNSSKLVD